MSARALQGLLAISLDELHPSAANPRDQLKDIDGLAESIREHGLIQPIVVQRIPGKPGFQIVAGHRRHAAAKQLGLRDIPCVVRRDMLPDEELLTMLVENGQRSGLDPIEEARAVSRLKAMGLTNAEIGKRVGRHAKWVQERLMLLTLPPQEQEEVRAGHYKLGHALNLVRANREQERRRENPVARPVGRPKGAKTKPYFGDDHPLGRSVRTACSHVGKPKVGGVGCGECGEAAIRADERQTISGHLEGVAS